MNNFVIGVTLLGLLGFNAAAQFIPFRNPTLSPETIETPKTCLDLNYEPLREQTTATSNEMRIYRLQNGELCQFRKNTTTQT